jgi:Tol biopolymer transport system component
MRKIFLLSLFYVSVVVCQKIEFTGKPTLFLSGIVCSEKTEVKITFSNNSNLILWGCIGREKGIGGWDIWQSQKLGSAWSDPIPASFNSTGNDFDPCFTADGKKLYFFSNRPGGYGGDDIYFTQYDSTNHTFGSPVNMGPRFNTSGDEWGPSFSSDGKKFIYCTNGLGGKGKHDIFVSSDSAGSWSNPMNIESINSSEGDFDPVILHDNKTIVFTRKINEDEAFLYISYLKDDGYSIPVRLYNNINIAGTWNFGCSIDPKDKLFLYYSTHVKDNSKGRMDIYRIKYSLLR